jgi:hypothetical protein
MRPKNIGGFHLSQDQIAARINKQCWQMTPVPERVSPFNYFGTERLRPISAVSMGGRVLDRSRLP